MITFCKVKTVATMALLSAAFTTSAQSTPPTESIPASPAAQSSTTINGKTITLDYGAPSIRGRKILGELIPINKVWRTGDNAATTLRTPIDLKIGDLVVPAGTYTVYSIVTSKGYELIINKQTGQSGAEYDQSQDLGRTRLNTNDTADDNDQPFEKLVIAFENTRDKKTELHIKWGYSESWLHITAQ
jgi:hypothetical protein